MPVRTRASRADRGCAVAISRCWAVVDAAGARVCVTLYKRGADEVVRRLRG